MSGDPMPSEIWACIDQSTEQGWWEIKETHFTDTLYVRADLVRELVKVALRGRDLAEFEGDTTTASDIATVVNKINAVLGDDPVGEEN